MTLFALVDHCYKYNDNVDNHTHNNNNWLENERGT